MKTNEGNCMFFFRRLIFYNIIYSKLKRNALYKCKHNNFSVTIVDVFTATQNSLCA